MSMRNVGILDGDLVAVHRTPEVRNRQIVVARLENEVTVKRYKQEGTVVWLLPENQDFEPLRVDLKHESLIIEGVVVGVVRQEAAGPDLLAAMSLHDLLRHPAIWRAREQARWRAGRDCPRAMRHLIASCPVVDGRRRGSSRFSPIERGSAS